ncbi:DUF2075 domain-containing protein [Exiguobacterium sp. Leaf196]|uniref:DUF2075 domain-containing protein n=1 Tax=Exiguobacterium sp. Leaf196 TaxID=1736298 RepID=UPI0006F23640|nr:DUF2075 domain-containing protein [Exiguobacterium sp. Leaf196]KQS37698.1 endonuclease [Exiguobacterium sp. Leaf196]
MKNLYFEKRRFTYSDVINTQSDFIDDYPIVYLLYNSTKEQAYVGQTVQKNQRLKSHLKDSRRKQLDQTILVGHEQFNQSATYNIESNLINFLIADGNYKLQNVSQTASRYTHNYYQKSFFNETVFENIWQRLREESIAKGTLEHLRNKDVYKLSPYRELSEQQLEVKQAILEYCKINITQSGHHVFIVEGDAGTGKSVLLSSLFNTIQDLSKDTSSALYQTDNYLLVNHSEMLKTYKSIAGSLPNLKKKQFQKPTPFINTLSNQNTMVDIVLIDEAHLLLTKEDTYNNFHQKNQLNEIITRSKVTILIFDPKQVLKIKSHWGRTTLQEIVGPFATKTLRLSKQFRMQASQKTLHWINRFVEREILPLPSDSNYDFQIFEDPEAFKQAIFQKNQKYGLSRMVSTFDYLHKKDGADYYVDEDGINLPWNRSYSNITWAEQPETINEVGSIYTIQGFDLNYVGVVLGPSIQYDEETQRLVIDPTQYKDKGAFTSRQDLSKSENEQAKEDIILNSLNVLMKRGVKGLYLYATNLQLRKCLLQLKENDS